MPTVVLLVEDNSGDARLMREIFLGINNSIRLLVVSDGVEAISFLEQTGKHSGAPRPDIILLDLNLPRMDGHEVLAYIKSNDGLKSIPIIVLTTSSAETDIVKSYELRANCYMCKPGELNEFEKLMYSICDFWLVRVKLPKPTIMRQ
jgi:two-component system, chemotaxis family, response regulator Rcp1